LAVIRFDNKQGTRSIWRVIPIKDGIKYAPSQVRFCRAKDVNLNGKAYIICLNY
jgi:hypothetical protein